MHLVVAPHKFRGTATAAEVADQGRLDQTSLEGKVVGGVLALASAASVPRAVIAGQVDAGVEVPAGWYRSLIPTAISARGKKPSRAPTTPPEESTR